MSAIRIARPVVTRNMRTAKGVSTTGIFGAGDIIHIEEHPNRNAAARRERQIKSWTRAKKLALAANNLTAMHALSACRKA